MAKKSSKKAGAKKTKTAGNKRTKKVKKNKTKTESPTGPAVPPINTTDRVDQNEVQHNAIKTELRETMERLIPFTDELDYIAKAELVLSELLEEVMMRRDELEDDEDIWDELDEEIEGEEVDEYFEDEDEDDDCDDQFPHYQFPGDAQD